jgi:hypothetical protein
LIDQAHRYGLTVTGHLDSGSRGSVNPRDAIYMGIDRIEHFMGGDAIVATAGAYTSLEALDVNRPEVDAVIQLYLRRNVYYDATVSAYGYWYNPKDPRVFTPWVDEQSFLTPHAKQVVDARAKPQMEQFHRIYDVKLKEVKKFYDAGGGRLITVGTDHPSWGEYWSGFGTHRELNALVVAGIPPAGRPQVRDHQRRARDGAGRPARHDRSRQAGGSRRHSGQSVDGHSQYPQRHARDGARPAVRRAGLLDKAKGSLGPKTAADDDWWKGNVRLR